VTPWGRIGGIKVGNHALFFLAIGKWELYTLAALPPRYKFNSRMNDIISGMDFFDKNQIRTPLEIKPSTFEPITISIRIAAGSVVGIAVTLQAGRSTARIPIGVTDFSILQTFRPFRPWGPCSFLFKGYRVLGQWLKRPGFEVK
jgi:hypothetical protein